MTHKMDLLAESNEKGRLLREAIKIVEKLSKNRIADSDMETEFDEKTIEEIKECIIRSRALKNDRWWQHLYEKAIP